MNIFGYTDFWVRESANSLVRGIIGLYSSSLGAIEV